jgi:DMSO/TMAO reductase YedYZ molybdopterin-dependent catalytic subunit
LPFDKYQTGEPPGADDAPPGTIISPDTQRDQRIPPGQSRTRKWPVLDAGQPRPIDVDRWSLTLSGLVDPPLAFGWREFQDLPRTRVLADFHCVTRWSRLGNLWEGVAVREVLKRTRILPEARYVLVHAELGWTTNLPLAVFLGEDVLFADHHDGAPLEHEHGGPVRLVVPRLYAWKSAKWVRGVELRAEDSAGFWEQGGYHMRGDPWREERHRSGARE